MVTIHGRFFCLSNIKILLLICLICIFTLIVSVTDKAYASDQENCLLCHKYPLLATISDNGTEKSLYVSDEHYLSSVHSAIRCSECHTTIKKVPHEKGGVVNCTASCHITDPTIGRKFAHKDMDLKNSAHDINYKFLNDNSTISDFPTCISCHVNDENKLILQTRKNLEQLVIQQAKAKCYTCHTDITEFVNKNIIHVLRRTERIKTPKQITAMCESCHNNEEMNARHKSVNAIYTYYENYHGKIMKLGAIEAPTCIDCHVTSGQSPHAIKSKRDPSSATHENNRGVTCTRADCHPNASEGLGKAYIHVDSRNHSRYTIEFYLMVFFTILTVGSFLPLMIVLILELIRMLFPHFKFGKKGDSDEK